jgi:hypothetical protein
MSGDQKTYEGSATVTRPIIPTPYPSSTLDRGNEVLSECSDANTMLRHYYNNYQKLKKENQTLGNQLAFIEKEREDLR